MSKSAFALVRITEFVQMQVIVDVQLFFIEINEHNIQTKKPPKGGY